MSKWYVNETLSLTGFFDLVNVSTLDHGGLGYFVCMCRGEPYTQSFLHSFFCSRGKNRGRPWYEAEGGGGGGGGTSYSAFPHSFSLITTKSCMNRNGY